MILYHETINWRFLKEINLRFNEFEIDEESQS